MKVILINNNEDEFKVIEGMKVAQFVCEKICLPEIQIVDKLEQTERGSNGFGSTGILSPTDRPPLRCAEPDREAFGSAAPEAQELTQETQINKKFEFTYLKPKCYEVDSLKSNVEDSEVKKEN